MKIISIKKSPEFQKIGKKGQKFYSKTSILLTYKTPELYSANKKEGRNAAEFCRIGYTVSKSVSKLAVERNLAKRRLRAAFNEIASQLAKNSYDYIIIARKEIIESDYNKIIADLKFSLKRIHQTPNKTLN